MLLEIPTALIATIVAVISAAFSVLAQFRLEKLKASLECDRYSRDKQGEAERLISCYREPLVHAAHDLQSKLFNILRQGLLELFYVKGNESEREYTVQNTVYVLAQFLCWREIIRRELQFLDLGEVQSTRHLTELTDAIEKILLTNEQDPVFRIFKGEQRAIGEKLIVYEHDRLVCMGYAAFVENQDEDFRKWFRKLENDILTLTTDLSTRSERVIALQRALIDLIDYLDPQYVRFQEQYRQKA